MTSQNKWVANTLANYKLWRTGEVIMTRDTWYQVVMWMTTNVSPNEWSYKMGTYDGQNLAINIRFKHESDLIMFNLTW